MCDFERIVFVVRRKELYMHISLSEIMNLKSETRNMNVELEAESMTCYGETYDIVSKEPVRLTLTSVGTKSVLLKAAAALVLSAPCSRCLEQVEVPFDFDLEYKFNFTEDGRAGIEDDDEPVNYINGYELDVDAFIGEEVMIGFPMKVLCSEECKGICTVCGANLNRGECGCDRTVLDPRMSIIRDLFRQKEV